MRKAVAGWNLGLALFSVVGTVRTLPELVRLLSVDGGFHRSVCDARWVIKYSYEIVEKLRNFWNVCHRSQYSPMYITWVAWFGLSNVTELGDTVFLVLWKRPLTLLHVRVWRLFVANFDWLILFALLAFWKSWKAGTVAKFNHCQIKNIWSWSYHWKLR